MDRIPAPLLHDYYLFPSLSKSVERLLGTTKGDPGVIIRQVFKTDGLKVISVVKPPSDSHTAFQDVGTQAMTTLFQGN